MTFLETYENFFVKLCINKVGKFQADRMLFVGMAGQNHKVNTQVKVSLSFMIHLPKSRTSDFSHGQAGAHLYHGRN